MSWGGAQAPPLFPVALLAIVSGTTRALERSSDMAFFFPASAGPTFAPSRPDLILAPEEAARQRAASREQARAARTLAARLIGEGTRPLLPSAFPEPPQRRRRGR